MFIWVSIIKSETNILISFLFLLHILHTLLLLLKVIKV